MHQKVFVYIVHCRGNRHQLLAFESHDEPGFEVPKGSVEAGESLEEAACREVREESGLEITGEIRRLGTTTWQGEEQTFVRADAPVGVSDAFAHAVTGSGIDAGLVYVFRWLPLDAALSHHLVQGCDAFVDRLLAPEDGNIPDVRGCGSDA